MKSPYVDAKDPEKFVRPIVSSLSGTRGRRPLPPLDGSALLLVDLQRIFVEETSPAWIPAWGSLAPRVRELEEAFRRSGRPIVRTRHVHPAGDDGGTIVHFFGRLLRESDPLASLDPSWTPAEGDILFDKARHSAFSAPGLEEVLRKRGVGIVVVAGVQLQLCVLATAVDAGTRGFLPVVALDGVAAPDAETHAAALRALSCGLVWVSTCAEIRAALKGTGRAR